ncbi:MAG: energy transducer TonB [Akkermansiaceae bacterium]
MSKPRHVYRPPRPNRLLSRVVVVLSGAIFTLFVFVVIPLMQRLDNSFQKEKPDLVANVQVQEQEEYVIPDEIEQPEEEVEPPPPEPAEAPEVDLAMDLPDLGTGGTGRVNLNLSAGLAAAAAGFDEGEMDAEPTVRSGANPTIPRSALKKLKSRGTARVIISGMIDERGNVIDASVKQSSGISSLDEAALKAFRRYKFSPAIKGGAKAKARVSQPFTFRAPR